MKTIQALEEIRKLVYQIATSLGGDPADREAWETIRKIAKKQRDTLRPEPPQYSRLDASTCELSEPLETLWRQYESRHPGVKMYIAPSIHAPGPFAQMDDGKCQVVFNTKQELVEALVRADKPQAIVADRLGEPHQSLWKRHKEAHPQDMLFINSTTGSTPFAYLIGDGIPSTFDTPDSLREWLTRNDD